MFLFARFPVASTRTSANAGITPGLRKTKERMVGYMTECITKQLTFSFIRKQKVTVDFNGGEITSDAGLLLVRQADNTLQLMPGMAGCITDRRDNRYTDHNLETLLRQRTYQIVGGYEDCNDANVVGEILP